MVFSLITRESLEALRRIVEPFAQQIHIYDLSGTFSIQRVVLVVSELDDRGV